MPNNVGLRRSFSRFGVVRADSGLVLGLAKTFCIGHRGGYSRNAPAPVGFRGTPDLRGTASASLSDRFRTSRPDLSPTVNTDCPPRAPQGVFADWSLGLRSRSYICANDCASSPASVSESPIRNRPRSEGRSGGEGCKKALSVGAMRKGGRSRRIFIRLSCIAFCAERRCRRRTGHLN